MHTSTNRAPVVGGGNHRPAPLEFTEHMEATRDLSHQQRPGYIFGAFSTHRIYPLLHLLPQNKPPAVASVPAEGRTAHGHNRHNRHTFSFSTISAKCVLCTSERRMGKSHDTKNRVPGAPKNSSASLLGDTAHSGDARRLEAVFSRSRHTVSLSSTNRQQARRTSGVLGFAMEGS